MKSDNRKSFTITEIIIVVIIIGIIASFAIPSYTKALKKANERDLFLKMQVIASANKIYKAKNGKYWPGSISRLSTEHINNGLEISLPLEQNFVCTHRSGGLGYYCYITVLNNGVDAYAIRATDLLDPYCCGDCPIEGNSNPCTNM